MIIKGAILKVINQQLVLQKLTTQGGEVTIESVVIGVGTQGNPLGAIGVNNVVITLRCSDGVSRTYGINEDIPVVQSPFALLVGSVFTWYRQ